MKYNIISDFKLYTIFGSVSPHRTLLLLNKHIRNAVYIQCMTKNWNIAFILVYNHICKFKQDRKINSIQKYMTQ